MFLLTAAFSLQSYIFAHLLEVFQFTGEHLQSQGNFWSLMFFILALGIGVAYFCLGFVANHLSVVSIIVVTFLVVDDSVALAI